MPANFGIGTLAGSTDCARLDFATQAAYKPIITGLERVGGAHPRGATFV